MSAGNDVFFAYTTDGSAPFIEEPDAKVSTYWSGVTAETAGSQKTIRIEKTCTLQVQSKLPPVDPGALEGEISDLVTAQFQITGTPSSGLVVSAGAEHQAR